MSEKVTHDDMAQLIIETATEVASTMLGLELEVGEPYLVQNEPAPMDGVVALIGLAGEWVGTGTVSCDSQFACLLSAHLLMSEYEAVNEEVLDALAEITNMIIGNVKSRLEDRVGRLGLSIPTVVYGRNFTTRSVGRNEWTVVPFRHDGHTMEVQLCLAPNRDGAASARIGIDGTSVASRRPGGASPSV